jgi:hypothetical protein
MSNKKRKQTRKFYEHNGIYAINEQTQCCLWTADHWLESIDEFPYFQSARALRLKGLYNQNSFKYNFALSYCCTQPTEVFCLISLLLIHLMPFKKHFWKKETRLLNITVIDSHEISIQKKRKQPPTSLERSILLLKKRHQ